MFDSNNVTLSFVYLGHESGWIPFAFRKKGLGQPWLNSQRRLHPYLLSSLTQIPKKLLLHCRAEMAHFFLFSVFFFGTGLPSKYFGLCGPQTVSVEKIFFKQAFKNVKIIFSSRAVFKTKKQKQAFTFG